MSVWQRAESKERRAKGIGQEVSGPGSRVPRLASRVGCSYIFHRLLHLISFALKCHNSLMFSFCRAFAPGFELPLAKFFIRIKIQKVFYKDNEFFMIIFPY